MNIALIGMPASGKTTVALYLSKLLKNYSLVDIDEQIVKSENKSINDIFLFLGESYFRNLETQILKELLKNDNQIISTGGGIVITEQNIRLLKDKAVTIYLKANIDTLLDRVNLNNQRPLLNNVDKKQKLEKLLKERENNYKKSDYTIETDGKTVEYIANEVLRKINENSKC